MLIIFHTTNKKKKLPDAFWDMVIHRSPRLKMLTLGHRGDSLHSRRALEVTPILQATWGELASIRYCRLEEDQDQSFSKWISTHKALESLVIHGLPDLRYRELLGNLR
ncbi:hypothetical protein E1B28_003200 [Marasmius oreades]|uniref:Uncharacterized protein n=1 Tax=Marasmius oreades TaxID=181124 RepID=A0A9P7UN67_9AGAR|nr:uncharacterized protein E1B28_003200 [Marasmius oreades]KAG7085654.1 hypothetical protein E1B28_003200 [Marasmius oreades]